MGEGRPSAATYIHASDAKVVCGCVAVRVVTCSDEFDRSDLPKGTGRKERSGGVCVISSKRKEIKEAREKPLLAGRKRRLRGCVVGLEESRRGARRRRRRRAGGGGIRSPDRVHLTMLGWLSLAVRGWRCRSHLLMMEWLIRRRANRIESFAPTETKPGFEAHASRLRSHIIIVSSQSCKLLVCSCDIASFPPLTNFRRSCSVFVIRALSS